jgi:hypothetical protein
MEFQVREEAAKKSSSVRLTRDAYYLGKKVKTPDFRTYTQQGVKLIHSIIHRNVDAEPHESTTYEKLPLFMHFFFYVTGV